MPYPDGMNHLAIGRRADAVEDNDPHEYADMTVGELAAMRRATEAPTFWCPALRADVLARIDAELAQRANPNQAE